MVQIIQEKRQPSFLERIGPVFQQTLPQAFTEVMGAREENKALKELTGQDLSGLSPDLKKLYLEKFMSQKKASPFSDMISAKIQAGQPLTPEEQKTLAYTEPKAAKSYFEAEERLGEAKSWKGVISGLKNKLKSVGPTAPFLKGKFAFRRSKTAKEREAFDVLAFQLERYARAAHTKGPLAFQTYQSLLSKLPSSKLTEAENEGRIEEWERALAKDFPEESKVQFGAGERPDLSSFHE